MPSLPCGFHPWILFPAIISYGRSYEKKHRLATPRQWLKLAKHTPKAIGVWGFPGGWFAIDFFRGPIVYLFYTTVLIIQAVTMNSEFKQKLVTLGEGWQTDEEVRDNLASVTRSFRLVANLTVLLQLFATAAVLVLGLRILNTFRGHVGLTSRTSTTQLSYYWAYMAIETFVLLNIVLAIVVDAYQEEKTKKDKNKCWVFRRVANSIPAVAGKDQRSYVDPLLSGRQSPPLRRVLGPKSAQLCCTITFEPNWKTSEAAIFLLTGLLKRSSPTTKLNIIFPEARIEECEATLAHLAVEQQHQSSHDLIDEAAAVGDLISAPEVKSKLDSIRSIQSPTDSMPDDMNYSPSVKKKLSQDG
ncbi:unnamed protein product [Phytophthora lilii]|uniref:Unnamed protein product n=1 Tax=Phytophthora lilii TaxID=2077276 RepID=A0A9W6WNU2_9STRA|nr:unnamed protein product [Phytophthora lilii]